ncbi:putative trans-sialidase [Trypanosoma cruzi]|nr:putative trans-sialidase [Trypanosoma cruzi]
MKRIFLVLRATPQRLQRTIKCFYLWRVTICGKNYGRYNTDGWDIQLAEGDATHSNDGMQSKLIDWAEPKSLSRQIPQRIKSNLSDFEGGSSGIVMQGGTLVFTLRARNGENQSFSRITYSTDNGNNWVFPEGISPAECFNPRITEWNRRQIFMIVQCKDDQSLFDSRDMGATWTRVLGTLSGVWTNSQLGVFREDNLPLGALSPRSLRE